MARAINTKIILNKNKINKKYIIEIYIMQFIKKKKGYKNDNF